MHRLDIHPAIRLTLAACLPLSACGGEEGCPSATKLAIVDLAYASHQRLVQEFQPAGTELDLQRFEFAGSGEAVPVDEYMLQVITRTVAAETRRAKPSGGYLDWLIGTAQALDCSIPAEAVQRPTALDVRSDAALSETLPVGVSLADAARVYGDLYQVDSFSADGTASGTTASGTDVVPKPDGTQPTLAELQASRPRAPLALNIRLDADVAAVAEHRFTITYSVDSGETFTLTTEPVTLTPSAR